MQQGADNQTCSGPPEAQSGPEGAGEAFYIQLQMPVRVCNDVNASLEVKKVTCEASVHWLSLVFAFSFWLICVRLDF